MEKQIEAFEIIDHGVESSSYFRGCGVSFTEYDDVFTGIGDTASEAFGDAIEQAAMSGYETVHKGLDDKMEAAKRDVSERCDGCESGDSEDDDSCDGCELWRFVSLRVKGS